MYRINLIGFENAEKHHIQTAEGENFEEFMVLELQEKGLQGIHGRFYIDKADYNCFISR